MIDPRVPPESPPQYYQQYPPQPYPQPVPPSGPAHKKNLVIFLVILASVVGIGLVAVIATSFSTSHTASSAPATSSYVNPGDKLIQVWGRYFHNLNGSPITLQNNGVHSNFSHSTLISSSAIVNEDLPNALRELGFDSSVANRMAQTNGASGVQTAEAPNYTASWTYYPDNGLDIYITVKNSA